MSKGYMDIDQIKAGRRGRSGNLIPLEAATLYFCVSSLSLAFALETGFHQRPWPLSEMWQFERWLHRCLQRCQAPVFLRL